MKEKIPLHQLHLLRSAMVHGQRAALPPGELIRLLRQRFHMTQRQLARRCHLPQPHLALIEQGKKDFQYSTLAKILRAFSCKPVLNIQAEKDFEEMILERVREIARARVHRALGTMALESQEPDNETSKEMIRREEQRLLNELPSEIWDDETV
jgi:transcriptional regulator with XRE-family HTH domain